MSITVEGPDGAVHEFPEGTSPDVIKRVLDRRYGKGQDTQAARTSAVGWAVNKTGAGPKRGALERLGDNLVNTVNTSAAMEFARSRFTNPLLGLRGAFAPLQQAVDMADRVGALVDAATGKPVRQLPNQPTDFAGLARKTVSDAMSAAPAARGAGMGFSLAGEFADKVKSGTRQSIAEGERQRRADFAAKSKADPFYKADGGIVGKTVHGGAALLGVLAGTALDPTSYVTGGSTVLQRVLVQGAVAAGADLSGQSLAIDEGLQDNLDLTQTAMSAGAGALFQGVTEIPGAVKAAKPARPAPPKIDPEAPLDAQFKPELDAADILAKPVYTTRALPDLRVANDNASIHAEATGLDTVKVEKADPGPDPKAPEADPWEAINWGETGSGTRKLAAAAHLETLRRTIKPEHAKAFGDWIARGAPRMLGDGHHARVNPDWIDWDSLSSNPDEFMNLEASLQAFFKDTFEQAGTASKSWEAVDQAAKVFGTTLSNISTAHGQIVGANGEAGLAAKLVALQSVADSHADNLVRHINKMKQRVAEGNVNAEDVAKLAAGVQEAALMDAMAAGASSEVGRALNVLKMARQKRRAVNDLEAAMDFLREAMGADGDIDPARMQDILHRMSKVYRNKGTAGLKDEIRKVRELGFWDYAGYAITGGLLSAPKSFVRNLLGSVSFVTLNLAERYVAAGIGAVRTAGKGADRVTFREANAYAAGMRGSIREAFAAGLEAFKHGGAGITDSSVLPGERFAHNVPFKMSPDRWSKWQKDPVRNLPEMMAWGIFSATRTLGFRPSIAMDEFTKTLGRSAQLNALAVREAHYRAAREADPAAAKAVFDEVLDAVRREPTADALKAAREFFEDTGLDAASDYSAGTKAEDMSRVLASLDIRKMVEDHARELAFQKVGPTVKKVDDALRAVPIIKYFYAPFLRTPFALLKAGLVDRTPLALAGNRKALFGAANELNSAIERGGAEADIAWAKVAMGLGLMATAFALYEKGHLVGGRGDSRSAERQDGVRPYSIRIGDEWVDFSPLSPLAEPFGLVADLAQLLGDRQPDQRTGEALMGAVMTAISNNILNKTTLQGLHQLDSTLFGKTPGGSEEAKARNTEEQLAATAMSAVPLSSLLRSTAQEIDPVRREAHDLLDQFAALTPGLSQRLPAMRDAFGRPLVRQEGETGVLQALNHTSRTKDPMALELARLGQTVDLSIARPPRTFNGERVEPEEYGRILEIQGQLWRHPRTGMNMEEAVRDLMKTDEYRSWPDEQRAQTVKELMSKYRKLANRDMKDPDSQFYQGELAKRTGIVALRKEMRSKGLSDRRALSRGTHMGLSSTDAQAEIEAIRSALDLEDQPQE